MDTPSPDIETTERLIRRFTAFLGSRDLAEDAFQDAMISLWQTEPKTDRPMDWLGTAVRYQALQMRRGEMRRKAREERYHAFVQARDDEGHTEDCPLCRREEKERLHLALEAMGPTEAATLRVFYLEGLSYRELADRFGVQVGTVASRLNRARLALKRLFEEQEELAARLGGDSGQIREFPLPRRKAEGFGGNS